MLRNDPLAILGNATCKSGEFLLQLWPILFCKKQRFPRCAKADGCVTWPWFWRLAYATTENGKCWGLTLDFARTERFGPIFYADWWPGDCAAWSWSSAMRTKG